MKARTILAALATAILAACGSGGDDSEALADPSKPIVVKVAGFVTWQGSAGGELLADASGDLFRVATLSDGQWCLFDERRQAVIVNWCRPAQQQPLNVFDFSGLAVSVSLAKRPDGSCWAGLVDVQTRRFIEVTDDAMPRAVVSSRSPTFCL